jgi:uncharacterized integral membrane protein
MAATTGGPAVSAKKGVAISPKLIGAGIIAIATIWFVAVNTNQVPIYLWVPRVTAPMWLVLLVTFAGGMITGLLLRRGKKNKQQDA